MLFKRLTYSKRQIFRTILLAVMVLPMLTLTSVSCRKDRDYSRKEFILVSDSLDAIVRQNQARILLPLVGATQSEPKILYVWSNVDYEITFQTDDETEDWIKVIDRRHNPELGVDEIHLQVEPMKDSYVQRTGTLSLKRSDIYLSNFVKLVQGYPSRIGTDFDWLQYGSNNPLEGLQGKLISEWSEEDKKHDWRSNPAEGSKIAYCYGRDGFIQLGDDKGHGAELVTPYNVYLKRDTVLMAAFNAVAYKSLTETDGSKLTIEVTGGGEFLDGTKSKTIDVKHMDPTAEDVATDMWKDTYQGYYIVGTKDNPLTGDTHIRLMAGDWEMTEGNNRIFIDNFNVLTIKREWWDRLFDEYPWEKTE